MSTIALRYRAANVKLAELRRLLQLGPPVGAEVAQACQYDRRILAAQCGCSIRSLERVFRAAGRSPHLWLREQRRLRHLNVLEGLHAQGKLESIKRLAIELGYRHPDNFIRDFRRSFALPPKRFLAERDKALKNLGVNPHTPLPSVIAPLPCPIVAF
jgi:AraC-like DNA-binding protein